MTISPSRTLTKLALAAAVAASSLGALVATQAPAAAEPYGYYGHGPYRYHGRYWHHRRWHPAYYGPGHRYHAGFYVYL